VKAELQNYEIHSREDLILATRANFDQMFKEKLISVCISWIEKLKWMIKNGEKYYHK
jgi:hypothetical protein